MTQLKLQKKDPNLLSFYYIIPHPRKTKIIKYFSVNMCQYWQSYNCFSYNLITIKSLVS